MTPLDETGASQERTGATEKTTTKSRIKLQFSVVNLDELSLNDLEFVLVCNISTIYTSGQMKTQVQTSSREFEENSVMIMFSHIITIVILYLRI